MDQMGACTVSAAAGALPDVGVGGCPEPCPVSSSDRSDWTAQKKLLKLYGLGSSDQEAKALNFLSRLSARSVNTDVVLPGEIPIVEEYPPEDAAEASRDYWLPQEVQAITSVDHDIETNAGRGRDQITSTVEDPCAVKKEILGGDEAMSSPASQAGIAMLAAASARVQALDSIVDTLRAAYSLPGAKRKDIQSASAIRRRDKMRAKKFENSSFCVNPKSRKIKR